MKPKWKKGALKHRQAARVAACVLGAAGWLGASAPAAEAPAWPREWTAFGPVPPAAGMELAGHPSRAELLPGSALASIPEALEIGGRSYKGRPVSPDTEGRFDLGALFGGAARGAAVYLLAPLKAEQAATLTVGAGADWWMQWWLDGQPVFDTLAAGNRKAPISADNYTFDLVLAPGAHVLAAAAISGSSQFLLAARPADAAGAGYARAMADGRAQARRYDMGCITEAIGAARAAFESAAGLATNDTERAVALLALAEAWLADRLAGDPAAARAAYEQALGQERAWSRHKGQAMLGIGETWRREGQYARAREAYARAPDLSAHASILRDAACATARAYVLEGNAAAARAELENLLALKWSEADEPLKEQARALLEIVSLIEVWRRGAAAEPDRAAQPGSGPPAIETVVRRLRREHPRLFLTPELLERVKREGLTDWQRDWLAALKKNVDGYATPPPLDAERQARMLGEKGGYQYSADSSSYAPRIYDGLWGYYAAHAALVYRLTGERVYYERALDYLRAAAAEWELIRAYHRIPYSRAFVKIHALSAYDWLYNDMTPAERAALGSALAKPIHAFYWHWRRAMNRPLHRPYPYQVGNMSYSDNNVGWYLGLVFAGETIEGLNDEACFELLRDEYDQYVGYFRDEVPPPDGVKNEGAIGYYTQKLGVKVNFFDSYRGATGDNVARYVPLFVWFGNYTLWNSIDPLAGRASASLGYGWSDAYHDDNSNEAFHYPPLMRLADLYGGLGSPDELRLLAAIGQAQVTPNAGVFMDTAQYLTPASPLWMTPERMSDEEIHAALARLPRARFFPDPVGHCFMNSGWGSNDTYALFIAGRQFLSRKHYDENHFTIYKKGFLALDSGARAAGDLARDRKIAEEHEVNYYYDTIAHNCVLIRMEGETLPLKYGGRKNFVNAGGMTRNYGAQVRAFETDALYTYLASDATSCYHSNKAAEVVRQFLFVYPDWFVVFDRVESKQPDQTKTWLFHTQMEPVETGDTFRAEHRDGAVCVRTLLPRDRVSGKVGGPGKEFWADGRNWPLGQYMRSLTVRDGQPTPDRNLFGQWRMEIAPAQARTRELFLHLIQVGDKSALSAMPPSTLIEDEQTAGVEFQAGARTVRVVFNKAGDVGGHIRLAEGGTVLTDRPLAVTVQRQDGLALTR